MKISILKHFPLDLLFYYRFSFPFLCGILNSMLFSEYILQVTIKRHIQPFLSISNLSR